ncbi:hypothetical protein [Methylocystis sp. B8]|uniref:hypothetical protein n=1 Tax=Methylocystis sp. B8 TaxID=544938 RepID=UPI0010FF4ED3|nr:hypothetical protein [Methylocystis sp. B8]TLG74038.1 hypothetical protein FEV16_12355 [Methylocystis sp. B8]
MRRIAYLIVSVIMAQQVFVANADAKTAKCVVIGNGMTPYNGTCKFTPDNGGSFAIEPSGKSGFDGVTLISVAIVSPGVAEVRGLTRDGVNSRWGEAKRSKADPACWVGSDFKICVY